MLTHLKATCGHEVIYTALPDDPHHEAKVAKIKGRACRDCRLKVGAEIEARQRAAGKEHRKKKAAAVAALEMEPGELSKTACTLMPVGTVIQLQRTGSSWHGTAIVGERNFRAKSRTVVKVLKMLAASVCFDEKSYPDAQQ